MVYLGKKEDDALTVILVPTQDGIVGSRKDVESGYYDYSRLCPPGCDGDEGN